jgi:hypothetical protein
VAQAEEVQVKCADCKYWIEKSKHGGEAAWWMKEVVGNPLGECLRDEAPDWAHDRHFTSGDPVNIAKDKLVLMIPTCDDAWGACLLTRHDFGCVLFEAKT